MPRRALLASLVCALAASGCLTELGHCGPTYTSLSWNQPGLYDAIAATTAWRTTWDPGDGALPWENPWDNLTGLRLHRVTLELARPVYHTVGSISYNDPILARIQLAQDGVVRAQVEGDVADAVILDAFHRLAANASLATSEQVASAARAFLESKADEGTRTLIPHDPNYTNYTERIHWRHQARMPGPFRLGELLAELDVAAPGGPSPGQASATTGAWSFDFTLPTWRIEEVGADRSLTTDARGWTVYEAGDHVKGSNEELVADAAAWATGQGLPPLRLDGVHGSAYVC